jgi:hypothetical protein
LIDGRYTNLSISIACTYKDDVGIYTSIRFDSKCEW